MARELKQGFTTGAAAAAAAKAALLYLTDISKQEEPIREIKIRFLNNEWGFIPIHSIKKLSDNCAEAIVIKDAGDDPDVTHKAEIGARVSLNKADVVQKMSMNGTNNCTNRNKVKIEEKDKIDKEINIIIRGGKGVGIVTKFGLEIIPQNPAINLGPQTMIKEVVKTILLPLKENLSVDVEIFVPKGEELAKKTLNARLGILGGISILGTTGIVKPMSHDAYIATIKSGISVALAMQNNSPINISDNNKISKRTLVFTTGRRSEKVAISLFPSLPEEAFIQIGDFFKASIEAAITLNNQNINTTDNHNRDSTFNITSKNFQYHNLKLLEIIIVVFFGKAVKMAMGFAHTHAAKSELTMKNLAKWSNELLLFKEQRVDKVYTFSEKLTLYEKIANSNTARHAFSYIYPDHPQLIKYVGGKIVQSAYNFSNQIEQSSQNDDFVSGLKFRSILLDFDGNKIFDSEHS